MGEPKNVKAKIAIMVFFFFHVLAHNAIAQNNEIKFNLVEGNNGEPIGNITCITQDPYGYMWLSGQQARCLYRYDGNRMVTFRHDSLNANSLGGTYLETVYVDGTGMVWVGFDVGLDRFNPATGIFTHYRNLPNDPESLSPGMVNVILRDHKGILWIGTANGLDRMDERTGKFTHYRNEPGNQSSLSSNVVRAIYEDHQKTLWIGTGFPFDKEKPNDGGLNRMESDGTFTRFMHDANDPHSLINNKVRSIFEDSRGTFWVGTGGDGLHTMDRENGSFERHLYNPAMPDQLSRPPVKSGVWYDHITFITEDGSGAIWIGTYAVGISRYDPIAKKITRYESSNGYPDRSGWAAYKSNDGVLWISAQETSPNLYRVDPSLKNLKNIITGNKALSLLEDNERYLWTGVQETGLQQYDSKKKLMRQFKYDKSDSFSLADNRVNSIFQNQRDTLWLSTEDGISIFNKTNRHFTKLHHKSEIGGGPYQIQIEQVKQIIQDKNGLKWAATLRGLLQYNQSNDSIKQYVPDTKDANSISSERVTCIIKDRSDDIWAGTYLGGGVNRLNKQRNHFSHYLKGFNILCLYEDSAGVIWAGTESGLYRYDQDANTFIPFFDPNAQVGVAIINGITEDNSKNLWISTQSAIVKVDANRTQNFIYGRKFGIRANSLLGCGIYKTANGEILVGHSNGIYYFSPDELAATKQPEGIIVTDFFINSLQVLGDKGTILQKPIEETSSILLEHSQNNLSFRFAAIDYRAPEMNRYYAMLENYDDNWRDATGEKSAFYLNVPPGTYIFRVKTFNSDGFKAEKAIHIIISPPWWKTWWAYGLYALALGGAIVVFYSYQKQRIIRNERIKTQLKELAHAKEIEKAYTELQATQAQLIQSEKMASLGELTAGIAHEIQNPLNFVNNFSEVNKELLLEMKDEIDKGNLEEVKAIVDNVIDNQEKINHHGKRADSIVKGMLQHSQSSNGIKEPTNINMLADEYLRLAYHGLRAKDRGFNATLKTNFDERIGKINIIPQDIGRVILNLINNAFYAVTERTASASSAGQPYEPVVTVSTCFPQGSGGSGTYIQISVKDNGNGIPQKILNKIYQPFFTTKPTGQGTGLGLSLSYDIIKAHGGELKVVTKEREGSEFIIHLPVG